MTTSAYRTIQEDLNDGKVIIIDGATGTELERRGATMDSDVWCAMATLSAPQTLREIHQDYIQAGARVIAANTFSAGLSMLGPAGLSDRFDDIVRGAVELAMEARDTMNATNRVAVAGSMSHQMPLPPGTDDRDPTNLPSVEQVAENHRLIATTLAELNVDLIMLEMMSDPAYANSALEAAKATGLPVWMGYSCRKTNNAHAVSWTVPNLDVPAMLEAIPPAKADAAGIMHTNSSIMTPCIKALRECYRGPIMAYPDTGHFEMPRWVWADAIDPNDFARNALSWIDEGVQIIGGCCGTSVAHIDALANAIE